MTGDPVGVLVVHGIGSQRPGGTLDKLLTGLARSVRAEVEVERTDERHATLRVEGRTLRVYEVWWADVLSGEAVAGTFDPFSLQTLGWFPWLNQRHRCQEQRTVVRTLLWTLVVAPVSFVLTWMLILLAGIFKPLTRILDEVVADVTNYASSAGRSTKAGSLLVEAADTIAGRFATALDEAEADGCSRIVVVGHSLGSVVAYHGLTGQLSTIPGPARPEPRPSALGRVTGFITIGSPLEKIRWIWPQLVKRDHRPFATADVRWVNLRDRLDPVAGRLLHRSSFGPVDDVPLFGRAWLVTAHTAYERNPAFVRQLMQLIGVGPVEIARTPVLARLGQLLVAVLLSLMVIPLLLLPVVATCIVMVVFFLLMAVSGVIDNFQYGTAGMEVDEFIAWSFRWSLYLGTGVTLVMALGAGLMWAAPAHYAMRHQRWPEPSTPDPAD